MVLGIIISITNNDAVPPGRTFDKYFVILNLFSAIAIFFSLFAILSGLRVWTRANLRAITRLKFSLVAFACLFLTWFSLHWHLFGSAHRY